MKTIIARRLAPLGSPELQARYIENGTKDSYLLIEDILNDAYDCIRIARDFPPDRTGLTEREIAEIQRIEPLLDAIDLDDGRSNHAVLSSPEWVDLSEVTRSVIAACGFSLPEIVNGLESEEAEQDAT